METLLIIAIVAITLAVLVQAGVLIAIYLMSRRLSGKVESLMNDSRRLMAPVESMTGNLKSVTEDLSQTAKMTREQAQEVGERVLGKVDQAGDMVMRPLRQYSALAIGIAEGVRYFFFGPKGADQKDHAA